MVKKRYKPEEIVGLLWQVEILCGQGISMKDAIRQLGISEAMFYRWRKEYGGMGGDEFRRLKELEKGNERLRRAVSDLTLDKQINKGECMHAIGLGTYANAQGNFWASIRAQPHPEFPTTQASGKRRARPHASAPAPGDAALSTSTRTRCGNRLPSPGAMASAVASSRPGPHE